MYVDVFCITTRHVELSDIVSTHQGLRLVPKYHLTRLQVLSHDSVEETRCITLPHVSIQVIG